MSQFTHNDAVRIVPDPIKEFQKWYRQAVRSGTRLPEAMALATATRDGVPSVRTVLYRGLSGRGFVFFTNYNSRKARELARNPRAAVVFHWPALERQVRAEGIVRKISAAESDRYFRSRPRESRLSAWASPQSAEISGRAFLEKTFEAVGRHYGRDSIPRPPFWGGFTLIPQKIEFWEGQPYRLHDRLCYQKRGRGWRAVYLAP
jgi:pyridoxamine 5'-phosphate oxidase